MLWYKGCSQIRSKVYPVDLAVCINTGNNIASSFLFLCLIRAYSWYRIAQYSNSQFWQNGKQFYIHLHTEIYKSFTNFHQRCSFLQIMPCALLFAFSAPCVNEMHKVNLQVTHLKDCEEHLWSVDKVFLQYSRWPPYLKSKMVDVS